tara:strand:- start:37 stop:255 length:219 start_codon:yes stop_codon:yes gene_type:complete
MSNDKMIYNDDNTIGVDESSLNQLMDILTPRMKTQLAKSLHNKVVRMMDTHNNEDESGDWDDFTIKGNTLFL